jgi:hypothetical protein
MRFIPFCTDGEYISSHRNRTGCTSELTIKALVIIKLTVRGSGSRLYQRKAKSFKSHILCFGRKEARAPSVTSHDSPRGSKNQKYHDPRLASLQKEMWQCSCNNVECSNVFIAKRKHIYIYIYIHAFIWLFM